MVYINNINNNNASVNLTDSISIVTLVLKIVTHLTTMLPFHSLRLAAFIA